MTGTLHWQFVFNNYTTCCWTKHSQQRLSEKCFHYRVVIVQSSIPSPKSRNTNGLRKKCEKLIKIILMKEAELPSTFLWEVCVYLLEDAALRCLRLMSNLQTKTLSTHRKHSSTSFAGRLQLSEFDCDRLCDSADHVEACSQTQDFGGYRKFLAKYSK